MIAMRTLLFVLLLSVVISCNEEKIATFEDQTSFLGFEKNFYTDSLEISFLYYFTDEISYPIEVIRGGKIFEDDIEYYLSVDSSQTNLPAINYEIPSSCVFRGNLIKDTAYINLKNTEELQDTVYQLVLNIDQSPLVTPGVYENRKIRCLVTAKVVQPDWWDETITAFYLGTFSEKKYRLFMQVTGVSDLTGMNLALVRKYALELKVYLQENPTSDESEIDGIMKVTVIG